jgi:hypothetical protein
MMGIHTAWREGSDFSPSEAVFGSQLVLPGQFLSTPEPPSPTFLQDFQGVLAGRSPLPPLYDGPYLVLERSLHFFKLQVGLRIETVSTHRLKPCHTPEDAQPAEPPRRGCPPNAAEQSKVVRHTLSGSRQPKNRHRVSFANPVASFVPLPPRPPPAPPDNAARQPRSTARPARYTA